MFSVIRLAAVARHPNMKSGTAIRMRVAAVIVHWTNIDGTERWSLSLPDGKFTFDIHYCQVHHKHIVSARAHFAHTIWNMHFQTARKTNRTLTARLSYGICESILSVSFFVDDRFWSTRGWSRNGAKNRRQPSRSSSVEWRAYARVSERIGIATDGAAHRGCRSASHALCMNYVFAEVQVWKI